MENNEHIEAIIKRTFEIVQKVYEYQQEKFGRPIGIPGSRIIFPKYRKDEANETKQYITRVSEQELKQIFIEQLNKEIKDGWDVYYSVETPTLQEFCFSGASARSANFDLAIHDSLFNRIALIEFKANNADKQDHAKDFEKLNNQKENNKNVLRYFIEIVRNTNKRTFSNLHGKIEGNEDIFRCCSLSDGDITTDVISAPI